MTDRAGIVDRRTNTAAAMPRADVPGGSGISFRQPSAAFIAVFLAAFAVPLAYSFYTQQVWEDSYITLRHAENLLQGKGLLFNEGERVHGFTSPVNVLVLAACSLATGQQSALATLWLYRVVSAVAFAAGAVLLVRRVGRDTATHPLCAACLALFYIFDLKGVAFTANGMETAFLLFFLAAAIALWVNGDSDPWFARGVCWAGLMWSRPDALVYIGALVAGDIFFAPVERRRLLISLAKSAVVGGLLYAPWVGWAWWYYGSPVPQTVIAKSFVPGGQAGRIGAMLDNFLAIALNQASAIFRPIYAFSPEGEWLDSRPAMWLLNGLTSAASIFCCVYWLFPVNDRLGRAASLGFAIAVLYFTFMLFPAPWYLPPAALFGMVALARGAATLSDAVRRRRDSRAGYGRLHPLLAGGLIALAAGQIALFGLNAHQMRIQQSEIEEGLRTQLGLWLREHGQPDETVFLEPLGYIGYFSRMHMIDYPGLVAPQVVSVRREQNTDMVGTALAIMPQWLVLRPKEVYAILQSDRREPFERNYVSEREFNVIDKLNAYRLVPGKPFIYNDAAFVVFRRKDVPIRAPRMRD
jgi:hypothetical protein